MTDAANTVAPVPAPTTTSTTQKQGLLRGGQQPISGASIQLYAVGTAGPASPATPLLTAPVITDAQGGFNLTGLYACPSPSTLVYLASTGGNPGLATAADNSDIAMMNLLGPCGALTSRTFITLNELTTVAAVWALAPYMQSVSSAGSSAGDPNLTAAFVLAHAWADSTTGASPGASIPAGVSVPATTIDTLGNLLATCVNSAGGAARSATPCGDFFALATPPGGTAPKNIIDAARNLALIPTLNVIPLYQLLPTIAPFQPTLTEAPASWSLGAHTALDAPTVTATSVPGSATVSLDDDIPGTVIHYTLDGSAPTGSSMAYTTPFTLTTSSTLQAIALVGPYASPVISRAMIVPPVPVPPAPAPPQPPAVPQLAPQAAVAADSLVASFGINVHFNYYGSIYTNRTPLMIRSLQQLGVRHLRDAMCWQGFNPASPYYLVHQQLGALGIKTDYVAYAAQPLTQVEAFPPLVGDLEAVEPANEYDNAGVLNWPAVISAQQADLFGAIHSSASNKDVTVLGPSLSWPTSAPQLSDLSAVADAGNLHGYFGGWNPGSVVANPTMLMNMVQPITPGKSLWVTETGYFAQPGPFSGSFGVSLAAQAIYAPRALLEYALAGAARTYLYELADDLEPGQDPYNYHWGLLDTSGAPKPAFGAIASLLNLLSDPGPAFTPSPLAYTLTGGNSSVHHLLFQKRDGTYLLALWIEAQSYDFIKQVALAVPTQTVTLTLNQAVASADSIQWTDTGTVSTGAIAAAQSIPITVSDKLQIVRLTLH